MENNFELPNFVFEMYNIITLQMYHSKKKKTFFMFCFKNLLKKKRKNS